MNQKCCHSTINQDQAKDILSDLGLNRTSAKIELLLLLAKSHKPLSIQELHRQMKQSKSNISTIHRTIAQFKEKDLVRELNLGEDFFRYEYIHQKDDGISPSHHHHFVRCRSCDAIQTIHQCDVSIFEKMLKSLGYKEMHHYLEFTGVCAKCS